MFLRLLNIEWSRNFITRFFQKKTIFLVLLWLILTKNYLVSTASPRPGIDILFQRLFSRFLWRVLWRAVFSSVSLCFFDISGSLLNFSFLVLCISFSEEIFCDSFLKWKNSNFFPEIFFIKLNFSEWKVKPSKWDHVIISEWKSQILKSSCRRQKFRARILKMEWKGSWFHISIFSVSNDVPILSSLNSSISFFRSLSTRIFCSSRLLFRKKNVLGCCWKIPLFELANSCFAT